MKRQLPRVAMVLGAAGVAVGVGALVSAVILTRQTSPLVWLGMQGHAAIAALLIGAALVAMMEGPRGRRWHLGRALAVACTSLALNDLMSDPLSLSGPRLPALEGHAALGFALLGAALVLLEQRTAKGLRPSEVLALAAFAIGLLATSDLLYRQADPGSDGPLHHVAFATDPVLMGLALAVLFARAERGLVGVLSADAVGGLLTRRLLPALLVVPVLLGWLRLRGEIVGLYGRAFGAALMVAATTLLLGGLVLWTAAWLNRADQARRGVEDERARAEAQLRQSNALLDTVIDQLPLMLFMKEAERLTFVRFNRAGQELLGLDDRALLGKSDFDFFPAAQAEAFQAQDRLTLAGAPADLEEPIESPTGRRWLHTRKVAVPGPDGRPAFLLGISEDITQRREHDRALRRALLAAETNSRELESFCYSVSHDLRSPLRSIDGFSQALLEDHAHQLDAEGRTHLARVRGAAQRMAELIDDLLDLARVTRAPLERQPVELTTLARTVANGLAEAEPTRNVRFVIAEGLAAEGDARLIRVLLENLLGNAWKFTSRRPAATIEMGREDGPGGQHFFVRDDGAGFDMVYAGKLFGAFQRLHRDSEFEGTGIGLATCQRIVDRHGGRIWAEGAIDAGATFRFTLGEALAATT
jgi:PAS domain S-box-containing protein